LLGYLFDKQKYNKKLTILQLPEFPKMYREKYKKQYRKTRREMLKKKKYRQKR